jgi:hypothetical protein
MPLPASVAMRRALFGACVCIAIVPLASRAGEDASAAARDVVHRFAAGDGIPLAGGWAGKDFVVPPGEPALPHEDDEGLLAEWGIGALPSSAFDGLARDGRRLDVRVTGLRHNEFGPTFKVSAALHEAPGGIVAAEDVMLFWTGHLDLERISPVDVVLAPLDEAILRLECQARGLELRMRLGDAPTQEGQGVWYMDPLDEQERMDFSDPIVAANMELDIRSPGDDYGALIVGCEYRSTRAGVDVDFRFGGPALGYDLRQHAVVWRDAVDVDAHFSFLRLGDDVLMLHMNYNDAGEVYGWRLERFLGGGAGEARYFERPVGRIRTGIEGMVTWFFLDELPPARPKP